MLHDNYMTYGAKERAFESQNKMSSCEEFFSRLRKLAVTVDKESSELKGILEDSEISAYDENRACLLLRETLAEVKDFKKEVNDKVKDVQERHIFGDFISACGRLMTQTKEQINELESHLEKYGFIRPKEDLPDSTYSPTDGVKFDEDSAMKTSGERQHVSSSEQSDSGDGDIPFENSTDTRPQDITMETDHSENADNKENEEDIFKLPVPPQTFTKMIEVTPQRPFEPRQGILQDKGQMTPYSTPEAPQTTTPMIKSRLADETTGTPNDNLSTPEDTHLPSQPVTVTPMFKPSDGGVNIQTNLLPALGSPDLPAPPVMGTPGLKALGPSGLEFPSSELSFSLEALPPPPDITSVHILKPDDVIPTAPVQGSYLADHSGQSQHMFVQPLNENEYSILPVYVANQFSLKCINHHLDTINQFLLSNNEGHLEPAMLEQDLRNLLCLGAATKAFMLALVKTGRLKLAGKSIIFMNPA